MMYFGVCDMEVTHGRPGRTGGSQRDYILTVFTKRCRLVVDGDTGRCMFPYPEKTLKNRTKLYG